MSLCMPTTYHVHWLTLSLLTSTRDQIANPLFRESEIMISLLAYCYSQYNSDNCEGQTPPAKKAGDKDSRKYSKYKCSNSELGSPGWALNCGHGRCRLVHYHRHILLVLQEKLLKSKVDSKSSCQQSLPHWHQRASCTFCMYIPLNWSLLNFL